ncbi:MAG: histidine kinase [Chitinophagales bacterium]|nr:histidine kinase [Chitinophagales bacterium]
MAATPLSNFRLLIIFVTCFIVISGLHAGVLIWLGIKLKLALIDSIISNLPIVVACFAVSNGLKYYLPDKNRWQYIITWCIGLSLLCLFISRTALVNLFEEEDYLQFVSQSLPFRFAICFLLIGWMAMISVLWNRQEQQQEDEKRKTDAENLERKAELLNLRQQLQPHFLFNSLNSINALIATRPNEARKMVQQLSEFLRGTLRKDEKQLVKLEEELHLLELYLDIEKVRFGHRLQTEIICNEAEKEKLLPPLLLQPIVENAIKFGLYDTTGDVVIKIHVSTNNNQLEIEIQNPFDAQSASSNKGTGFGLSSVQRRLYLLFARNDLVKTSAAENIFVTTLIIPQV